MRALPGLCARRARSVLSCRTVGARPEEKLDHAVRQIISRAVASDGVIDIFAPVGMERSANACGEELGLSEDWLSCYDALER